MLLILCNVNIRVHRLNCPLGWDKNAEINQMWQREMERKRKLLQPHLQQKNKTKTGVQLAFAICENSLSGWHLSTAVWPKGSKQEGGSGNSPIESQDRLYFHWPLCLILLVNKWVLNYIKPPLLQSLPQFQRPSLEVGLTICVCAPVTHSQDILL